MRWVFLIGGKSSSGANWLAVHRQGWVAVPKAIPAGSKFTLARTTRSRLVPPDEPNIFRYSCLQKFFIQRSRVIFQPIHIPDYFPYRNGSNLIAIPWSDFVLLNKKTPSGIDVKKQVPPEKTLFCFFKTTKYRVFPVILFCVATQHEQVFTAF